MKQFKPVKKNLFQFMKIFTDTENITGVFFNIMRELPKSQQSVGQFSD